MVALGLSCIAIYSNEVAISAVNISTTTDLGNNPTGELPLTAPMTFGNLNIVLLLPEFMQKFPRLNVHMNLTDAVVDLVDESIDLAIRLGNLQDVGLVATRLAELEYVIVATPQYLAWPGTARRTSLPNGSIISASCSGCPQLRLTGCFVAPREIPRLSPLTAV